MLIVVETRTPGSFLSSWVYSDQYVRYERQTVIDDQTRDCAVFHQEVTQCEVTSPLNRWVKIPVLGRLAGITRIVLAIIHSVGHLCAALFTFNKGHLYHAAKGGCELLRGIIESIPILGLLFANFYTPENGAPACWMIKMYNPDHPDAYDHGWTPHLREMYPESYIQA